jgi:hypothetical protein
MGSPSRIVRATLDAFRSQVEGAGLALRGAFRPDPADCVPALADGRPAATLILFGFAGRRGWPIFAASPEFADGLADPLDRWSRRVLGGWAEQFGGVALYPFGGPPFLPFARWAQRAEPVHPSPLGVLIHPDWGLWHSYRGALALPQALEVPPPDRRPSPCLTCAGRPCLAACPVGAFTQAGYDVPRCTAHLDRPEGVDCRERGCLARHACPIGAATAPEPAQTAFHIAAFRRGQRR